ncbi:hypothetical protein LCGC14_1035060 [marine sediment metagenome]|uniref:Uncharacterized protein n=1 Tax=marine sediment metagenome TaxID=412755 RepID=A0A0F9MY35_9ZZZZ
MTKPLTKRQKKLRANARANNMAAKREAEAKEYAAFVADEVLGLNKNQSIDLADVIGVVARARQADAAFVKARLPGMSKANIARSIRWAKELRLVGQTDSGVLVYKVPLPKKKAPAKKSPVAEAAKKARLSRQTAKAKKASPKLSRNDRQDMEYVVMHVRTEGPRTVEDFVCELQGISTDSAQRAVNNAVERGWLVKDGGDYRLPEGHKGAKKAAPELTKEELEAVEELVLFLGENCPDDSPPVTAEELGNESVGGEALGCDWTILAALKLGLIARDGDGYRLAKWYKGAKSAKSKYDRAPWFDAKAKMSIAEYTEMESVIGYVRRWGYSPTDVMAKDMPKIDVPRAVANAVKLGVIDHGKLGYYLVDDKPKTGGEPKPKKPITEDVLAACERELAKCKIAIEQQRKAAMEALRDSSAKEGALRTKVDTLEKLIAHWELRNNVQVATYRLERWVTGTLDEGIQETGRSLIELRSAMSGSPNGAIRDATTEDWIAWATERMVELNAAMAILNRYSYPRDPVMTEAKPEPGLGFTNAIIHMVGQPIGDATWPKKGKG